MPDEEQPESPATGENTVADDGEQTTEKASEKAPEKAEKAPRSGAAKAEGATRDTTKSDTTKSSTTKSADAKKSDAKKTKPAPKAEQAESSQGGPFSVYGIASAVFGLVAVAALVLGLITWSAHRSAVDERTYRSRVLQTAASWTSVLINMNAENVEKGMQRLHDKTVGPLNGEFDAALKPYREVVQRIQSRSSGRIEAAALETVRHDLDADGAERAPEKLPSGRTDSVMVVATSIAENVGGKPQTVHWTLELNVTDVDGRLLISRLKSIR